ncbi:myosin heavy chain, cardiac muscle isoform-like [Heterodontus francisci]|uniref:myosin heavy chain, cardiac muscle isoform-like n=1 Tax=Heterodontus francisci TaxID=7792 RepID=UPI00355C38B1
MEHQKNFRHKILPRYLNVITSIVSLADIAIYACDQNLSETEETKLKAEVKLAYEEIQEAVNEGKEIQSDVDDEATDTSMERKVLQDKIDNMRKELQDVEKELISQEIQKEKIRDKLRNVHAELLHATETQNTTNARKAEKETIRNVGIGLILIPFIGIPMLIGTLKEIQRALGLSKSTEERIGSLHVSLESEESNLDKCYNKITELKQKRVESESLRKEEKELVIQKAEVTELFDAKGKVFDNLSYLSNLQGKLQVLYSQCSDETFYGMTVIKDLLLKIFTLIQKESFNQELLCDSRVLSKLNELDEKTSMFKNIQNI